MAFGDKDPQPVALYSTKSWKKLGDLPEPAKNIGDQTGQLAFSRDGKFLAVSRGGNIVLVYDLSSRKVIQSIRTFPDTYGGDALAYSPDASVIAVGSSNAGRDLVRLFSTKDGSTVDYYPEPSVRVETLDWSQDGRIIAFVTGRRVLHLWVPFKPKTTERRIDLDHDSYSIAFSPDGQELAVGVGRHVKIFGVAQ